MINAMVGTAIEEKTISCLYQKCKIIKEDVTKKTLSGNLLS